MQSFDFLLLKLLCVNILNLEQFLKWHITSESIFKNSRHCGHVQPRLGCVEPRV